MPQGSWPAPLGRLEEKLKERLNYPSLLQHMISNVTQLWFWIGFGGMVLGSLGIYSLSSRFRPEDRYHVNLALAVTVIASITYYGLARGQAEVTLNGTVVYFGRYLDWLLTTPLLLLGLLLIALPHGKEVKITRSQFALICNALFLDVLMIVTGGFAVASARTADIVFWFGVSCVSFLLLIALMGGEVLRQAFANGPQIGALYSKLFLFLSLVWVWYPVLWALGGSGFQLVSPSVEAAAYALLDVTAKAVFGIVLLLLLARHNSSLKKGAHSAAI